jgi:predicted NAD-dependent protein-ADP-ribosyltransferase YbiA (DUF1768 family)
MDPIYIRKVKDPYGWMGNMSPYTVEYNNLKFRTAEALFQWFRFLEDEFAYEYNPELSEKRCAVRDAIFEAKSPMGAKMAAKSAADLMLYYPRCWIDKNTMLKVLDLKFSQHPDLKQKLIDTGDAMIYEDCSKRPNESGLFWGVEILSDGTHRGENTLGSLLMELRQKYGGMVHPRTDGPTPG